MRRSDDQPRIRGPYDRGERYRDKRYRVDLIGPSSEGGTVSRFAFATWDEAHAFVVGGTVQAQGTTVRQAVDAYLDDCRERGCASTTVENYEHRLWRLLDVPANGQRPIRWVQPRGQELYQQSIGGCTASVTRSGVGARESQRAEQSSTASGLKQADARRDVHESTETKGPGLVAPDTHHNGLLVGRTWAKFCVEKRWLKTNPFAAVKPRGRRTPGSTKPRLKVDECRVLEAYCLAHGDDPACVLTYGYLMLGKRASELARVTTADLDDDGWLLRISKAKTEASVGTLPLSPQLREMLLGLSIQRTEASCVNDRRSNSQSASSQSDTQTMHTGTSTSPSSTTASVPSRGRSGFDRTKRIQNTSEGEDSLGTSMRRDMSRDSTSVHLFVQSNGTPLSRYAARDRVLHVTKAAIGRAVTPQELRRTFVDNANRQGFALKTIAEQTGHTSPAVTMRNYMSQAAADAGAVERNFKVYAGGKR